MGNPEHELTLQLPQISDKTLATQLRDWSKGGWRSEKKNVIAMDILNNCRELLGVEGKGIDWEEVLDNTRVERIGGMAVGLGALAAHSNVIGAVAASAEWNMHDPEVVYMSAKFFARIIIKEKFRKSMEDASDAYGQKTLGEDAQYWMKILDFLSKPGQVDNRTLRRDIIALLKEEKVQEACDELDQRKGMSPQRRDGKKKR